jgi:hypothetical protein
LEKEVKTIICQRCGKRVEVKNRRRRLCDNCQPLNLDDYQKSYQKSYRELRKVNPKTDEVKRPYVRKVLKNKPYIRKIDEYSEYCRLNWNTVEGCLNCIIPECIQETSNDSMLPWESEGFYESEYQNNI